MTAPVAALAQSQTPPEAAPEAGNGDSAAAPKTQIITDEEKGTVTIVIDGKPAVMIDKTGLYVVNEIMYGRSLTDTGPDWIKARIEKNDSVKGLEGGADDAE